MPRAARCVSCDGCPVVSQHNGGNHEFYLVQTRSTRSGPATAPVVLVLLSASSVWASERPLAMDDSLSAQLGRANEDTEMTRSVFAILAVAAMPLVSCGGTDSPAAPTPVQPPTTPIVVTLTAQVVANAAQGLRTVDDRGFVERRGRSSTASR